MSLYPKLTEALANSALIVVTEHRHFPTLFEIDGMEVDADFAEIAETEEELEALDVWREYMEAVHFGDVQTFPPYDRMSFGFERTCLINRHVYLVLSVEASRR